VLGVVSILTLIGIYSILSQARQVAKRAAIAEQLAATERQIEELESTSAAALSTAQRNKLQRLESQRQRLATEARTAVDRTVPTWRALWSDGLLRVIRPQGLRQQEYWLWDDCWATLGRLAAGLAVGVLLSVVLGLLMGAYSPVAAFFVPPLSFLAKIPPTAMLAVFFVLVGTSFKMYVAMIAFGILPTLAQTVFESAKNDVPDALIDKAYTLGASQLELIWNVLYKQILPRILDAVRLQIGPAMVVLVAAEWMVADQGFGYRLRLFYQRTDMTVVYLYCFLLGAIGLLADYALIAFRRWVCPWFGE
jgi:NitT/TauT family transport system permease protein